MKSIVGLFLIILGVVAGLFVGGYVCFYGGIVQVIDGIKAGWQASEIALGILRFVCTGVAGVISAMVLVIPGTKML